MEGYDPSFAILFALIIAFAVAIVPRTHRVEKAPSRDTFYINLFQSKDDTSLPVAKPHLTRRQDCKVSQGVISSI